MGHRAPASLDVLVVGEDASLVASALDRAADPVEATVEDVPDVTHAREHLDRRQVDCVVVTASGPEGDESTVVGAVRSVGPALPIVRIADDEATASAALAAGATDYVLRAVAEENPGLVAARIESALEDAGSGLPGSGAWYERLLEHSMDAITVVDVEGTFAYQSPSVERLLGYEPAALLGADSLEYVHPDDRDRVEATFRELIERGPDATEDVEYRFRAADGSWTWIESVVTARREPGIDGFVVNSRLIDRRKEREREAERYETLLSVLPDTIAITDMEGDHIDIYGHRGWSGYTREELIGENVSKTIPEEDRERGREVIREMLAEGREKAIYETRIVTKDGEVIPFENHVTPLPPDEDGEIPGVMSVLRDITERKHRRQELELKNRAMDEAPIGITITDVTESDPEVSYVNEGFEQLTGYGASDLRDEGWETLLGDETDPEALATLEAAYADEASTSTEILLYRKGGAPRWFQASIAPLEDEDGEVTHFVGFQQDITDLKEYETEIERRFDEFADVFAEDLRHPLEEARSTLEAARENGDDDALEDVSEWLRRADDLLEDLATVHSFSVPSRDFSESALRGAVGEE